MCVASLFLAASGAAQAQEATVVELTQTPCQFVESENGVDHGFSSMQKADCEQENASSGDARLAKSKVIELKAGKHIFRVTNKNVPYDLGFWIRGDGIINKAKLPSTSGGGLTTGTSKDYAIDLKAGDYVYSCPLNSTLDYRIVVTN